MLSCLAVLALLAPGALAAATLAEGIDAHLAAPRFAHASWGIQVLSLDSGRTLYAHDSDRLLVPASTAKLYTGALALARLGADFRIPTSLLASTRPRRDGTLHGNLILYGHGDPTLGTPLHANWAEELAAAARKAGIRKVEGDLVADATRFAAPGFGGGWEAADLQSWFAVPASALSIGENVVRVRVSPAEAAGQPARIEFEPEVFGQAFELDNRLQTVAASAGSDISLVRNPGERRLTAFGRVALAASSTDYRLALPDPPLLAGHLLRRALAEQGIEVTGKLRSLSWPRHDERKASEGNWRVADTWSPAVSRIVERGLKLSQNLYLQNLLLIVGAREDERLRTAAPGAGEQPFRSSEQLGLAVLRRYLAEIGIQADEIDIDDGAGLSRRNLSSAAAMVKLLAANADREDMRLFRTALPEAGSDGTLARRLAAPDTRGRVFAKTGAMRHVAALAGYATTAAGERVAFAILLNNYRRPVGARRASAELDAIVRMIVDNAPMADLATSPPAADDGPPDGAPVPPADGLN